MNETDLTEEEAQEYERLTAIIRDTYVQFSPTWLIVNDWMEYMEMTNAIPQSEIPRKSQSWTRSYL